MTSFFYTDNSLFIH